MLSVPSLRLNQFGVRFYEALLSGADLQTLVGFEVLSFGPGSPDDPRARQEGQGRPRQLGVPRAEDRRLRAGLPAADHPEEDRGARRLLPPVRGLRDAPGDSRQRAARLRAAARLLAVERTQPTSGSLKLPEESGILRALDGQHRLLALHQLAEKHNLKDFQVPAVVFDNLTPDQVVELFVTINSKHTKLNPSHLISLSGRRLYRDDNLAAAHDVIRALNEDEHFAAARTDQGARHRQGRRDPGLARRRAARRVRGDGRGRRPDRPRVPRERPPLLPELLQGRRQGLSRGVRRPQVLDQELDGAARLHPHRCPTSSR